MLGTYHTYKAAFEASPDAIIITGDQGEILLVNNQAEMLFGFRKEEMLGQQIELFVPRRLHQRHREQRDKYTAHPVPRKMGEGLDLYARRKDGSEFPVEISLSPIELTGRTVIAAAVRDVTARKEIERRLLESEQKYRVTLDNMLEGAMILDFDFRHLYVNNVLARQAQRSKEELIGHIFTDVYPNIDQCQLFKAFQTAMKERVIIQMENEFIYPDNSSGWFEISIQPVPEGIFVLSMEITERKKAQQALIESEERYRSLIENTNEIIIRIGTQGKITFYNSAFKNLLEYKEEELENLLFTDILDPVSIPHFHASIKKWSAGERLDNVEKIFITKSGKKIFVEGNINPDIEDGKVVGAKFFFRNVTERKKAEEEIARQKKFTEDVLNNLPADIAVFDQNHNYVFINPAAIGNNETRNWLIGKNDFDYFRYKGSDDGIALRRRKFFEEAVQTKTDVEWIDEHKTKQGTKYVLRKFHPVFENDQLKQVIGYGIDITERKKVEIKLQEAMSSSENAYKEVEQFAYMVSHDLQEPLRMITGFLNLLQLEAEEQLDESTKEYISYAVDGAERMKVLIQDLLKYSRVGSNKEDFALTDLNEVMQYVIHVLSETIEREKAVVKVKTLPAITGNKTLLNQLFVNLLSNALKYNNKKDPEIEIGNSEDKSKWTFFIKDNGIGIDPKYFNKIFEVFQRIHGRSEYAGTGIGLAICKKIVEKHNGTIWVESEHGKGSTFFFTIPKIIS